MKKCLLAMKKEADPEVDLVFPNTNNDVLKFNYTNRFKKICREAGVPWANLKALRHTFASRHAMAGRSLYKIQKWLGHASPTTTMVYAHLMPEKDEEINLK